MWYHHLLKGSEIKQPCPNPSLWGRQHCSVISEKMDFLIDGASKTCRASCVQIAKSPHSLTASVFSNPKMTCMTVLHSLDVQSPETVKREPCIGILVPKNCSPALEASVAAVPCIGLTFPGAGSCPHHCWGGAVSGRSLCSVLGGRWEPGGHEGKLEGPEPPPLPPSGLWLWGPAGAPDCRLPAGQPLSLPRTLLTPAQVRRVLGHLSSPASLGPGQQVDVLGNLSLPSEGLKD